MATRRSRSGDDPNDPAAMQPHERIGEIAAIFAAGVVRLRRGEVTPLNPPDSDHNCLDECPETRLHGHRG